jgi:long-chain acyl-CoA synthetase
VPLNFLLPPAELLRIVQDAQIDLVVAAGPLIEPAAALQCNLLELNAQALAPAELSTPRAGPDDLAVLLYTSGTAGDPKGVRLTFENVAQNALACISHARLEADQVFLSALPQFHSFGFTAMTVVPLMLGATVWFVPRFTPASVAHMAGQKRASVFMGVACTPPC